MAPFRVSIDPRGALGGLQAGYNWQTGNFVLGGEADIQIADIERTGRISGLNGNPAWFNTTSEKIDGFGTARLRAGYAFDRLLVYATGGLAYGHIKYSSYTQFEPHADVEYPGDASKWKAGWTIGGGLEYAVTDHWTVRGEYLYYDLGKSSYRAEPLAAHPPFNIKHTVDAAGSIGRLAVNYKF
ncbi:hypothetical protein GCM10007874_25470 [Labrys miyagiensis]|uniref:Outer membrane protein beta-barrel domain-containing protein n=1 Tax=Labrys miyagiensis TaxID=346912 RepID=A0ABQ6CHX4_9HYPH|nr:hypothetical protein GCM10007874_25470 [Labrys miyagiensis]